MENVSKFSPGAAQTWRYGNTTIVLRGNANFLPF